MGAFQQPVGGLQNTTSSSAKPLDSFKDVLETKSTKPTLFFTQPGSCLDPAAAQIGKHKGHPAIAFSKAHVHHISSSFKWVLIRKFAKGYNREHPHLGRPTMEVLKKHFDSLDFRGPFQIGLLDNRHLLIEFQSLEDYLHLYSTPIWHIKGIPMRILKWTSRFHVDKELPVAPVWIGLPRLPIHYFEHSTIFAIAGLIGNPLRIDSATATLKRPSIARVQVEIDLLEDHPHQVWISVKGENGFWQKVEYDRIPDYCQQCWHIGHPESLCRIRHPELRSSVKPLSLDSSTLAIDTPIQITIKDTQVPLNQPSQVVIFVADFGKQSLPAQGMNSATGLHSAPAQLKMDDDALRLSVNPLDKGMLVKASFVQHSVTVLSTDFMPDQGKHSASEMVYVPFSANVESNSDTGTITNTADEESTGTHIENQIFGKPLDKGKTIAALPVTSPIN